MSVTKTTAVAQEIEQPQEQTDSFQTGNVMTIVGGHFIHDTYTAFVAPLLPLVIEKLSLSLTLAGVLTAVMQIPAVLNPFIGYLADKISLRYFVIFAPAATATLIGLMGLAPTYTSLVILFILIGISVAAFHAPTPAMIARISGQKVGRGMSLYMAGGELGRTVGPIVAVAAVSAWGLEGIYRLIAIGWLSSFILLWRFQNVSSSGYHQAPGKLKDAMPLLVAFFLPLLFVVTARSFLIASITTYLPTYLSFEGSTLAAAGIALAVLEGAGVVGALASGTISDRFGRKPVLLLAFLISPLLLFVFLNVEGWLVYPTLVVLGFFSLSAQPVLLAMVQDQLPNNRATANGFYMLITFLMRSLVLVIVGVMGDSYGLRTTFMVSAGVALLAIPFILLLPKRDVQLADQ